MVTVAAAKPRRRSSAQIRSDLLAAAERMLGQKGFERTTINDITSEAGLGFGTFYRYFPSKEEIYRELVSEGLDSLVDGIDARCDTTPDARERLRDVVREVVAFAAKRPDLFLLLNSTDAGVREAVRRGLRNLYRCLHRWLDPAFADHTFQPVEPSVALQALVGMQAFAIRSWLHDRTMDETQLVDSLVRLAEGALFNAPAPVTR
jgi:AcrR family transcriptional regulator